MRCLLCDKELNEVHLLKKNCIEKHEVDLENFF